MPLSPLFLSHGSPTLPFDDVAARSFLQGLSRSIARPRAIVMVSAHWETVEPAVTTALHPPTIHDFYGFPEPLYQLRYPAQGDPALAKRVADLLAEAGLTTQGEATRGLDHGAWVPLMLAWPEADIPVVQLSLQSHLGPQHHLAVGRALAPLTSEGVLVVGSGNYTHDLSSFRKPLSPEEPAWVSNFADWFDDALTDMRVSDLLHYRTLAPEATHNHPTEEHLLPLFVALGAAGEGATAERIHSSVTFSVLRMDAYAFHPQTG